MSEQQTPSAQGTEHENLAMRDLLAGNRRRKKLRRWIGIGAILPGLVAFLLVAKFLSMYAFAYQSIRSFLDLDFGASVASAERLQPLNWFERYKADYNLGTALAEVGELERSRELLESALKLATDQAPALEECAVRYNLTTVIERQGDAATDAGDQDRGQELYREALDLLGMTMEKCAPPEADAASPDPKRSMDESQIALAKRIAEKIKNDSPPSSGENEQGDPPPPGEEPEQEPDKSPSESQLDELQQKLDSGARERNERDQNGQGAGGGTDRPW